MTDIVQETRDIAAALIDLALDSTNDLSVALSALSMAAAATARGAGMTLENYCSASDVTAEIIFKNPVHSHLN